MPTSDGLRRNAPTRGCRVGQSPRLPRPPRAVNSNPASSAFGSSERAALDAPVSRTPAGPAGQPQPPIHRPRLPPTGPGIQGASSRPPGKNEEYASNNDILELLHASRVGEAAHQCNLRIAATNPPAGRICGKVIRALLASARYLAAWQLFSKLRDLGMVLSYYTLHWLLVAAVRGGRCQEALQVLQYMRASGLHPNEATLVVLINGLLKSRKRGTAYRRIAGHLWGMLQSAERGDRPRNAAIYTTGIHVHTNLGQFQEAEEMMASMKAAGHRVTAFQFNIIMQEHSRRLDATAVRQTFRRMKAEGVAPDVVSFNILMQCFVRRGELVRAKAVLDKAVREGVTPCIRTYTIYMRALCQAGAVGAAEKVLQACLDGGVKPTVITYGVLIHGHTSRGNIAAAEQLLARMKAVGPLPNAIIFNSLITAHVATLTTQGFTAALRLLRSMSALGLPPDPDTFNIIMDGLVRLPDLPGAMRVFKQLAELGMTPDATLYTTLIKAFKVTADADSALKVFAEMRRSRDAPPDAGAWNALADVLACSARFEEAERAVQQAVLQDAELRLPLSVEGHGALINGYHRHNKVGEAVACLRRFLRMGGAPDRRMYDQVVDLCLRNGDAKTASQVVRAMELAGLRVDKGLYQAWFNKYRQRDASEPFVYPPRDGAPRVGVGGEGGYGVYMERFKFWLGMPNKYYDEGWP